VAAGPDFAVGAAGCRGSLMDVPATLLHLYDVPIPDDFDGRPLTEAISPQFLAQRPIRQQPGDRLQAQQADVLYTEEETEAIIDHLRALGYVD